MRTLNSRGLSQSFGRRLTQRSLGGLGDNPVDATLQQKQIELAQVQAQRASVEAELADLKARATRPRSGAPSRVAGPLAPAAQLPPDLSAQLDVTVGPGVVKSMEQGSVWSQIAKAPPLTLAVAGLAAVFVIRALVKRGA